MEDITYMDPSPTNPITAWIRFMNMREEFLSRYETVSKMEVLDNRRLLKSYCHADVTVLRVACRTFRRHILESRNVEVFLESMTIASVCNNAFRKMRTVYEFNGCYWHGQSF